MFTRLVSKEASGHQECNIALHSHLKICFQPKKWRKPSRPVSPLWLLCEKGIPSCDRKEQDRDLQIFFVSSDIISITYLCRKKSFLKLLIFWATRGTPHHATFLSYGAQIVARKRAIGSNIIWQIFCFPLLLSIDRFLLQLSKSINWK